MDDGQVEFLELRFAGPNTYKYTCQLGASCCQQASTTIPQKLKFPGFGILEKPHHGDLFSGSDAVTGVSVGSISSPN